MSTRTIFLSRLIGLYCIVVALLMVIRKPAVIDTVTAYSQSPSMMIFLGMVVVVAGLAMILAHNIWCGGALPVVVTLVGWLALIKGLLFLFLPADAYPGIILCWLRHPLLFYVSLVLILLIGIYLIYGGFRSRAHL